MSKVFITHNIPNRKSYDKLWLEADLQRRRVTSDATQAAVWLRAGFDVLLSTNAFDGYDIEIVEEEK